jgi:spoIIIJ-associated protein
MREIEKSAGSVEEAIELALEELGVSEQEAHIQIVHEPRGGFLGLNAQSAVVRVSAVSIPPPSSEAAYDDQGDAAITFLEGLMQAMGVDAEVELTVVEGTHYVEIWAGEDTEGIGLLIGKHGHTLDSLQELVRNHVQRATGERCAVMVDVEDYRKRRRAQIARRAREAARRVRKTGRGESLEPMTASERKVVHEAVAEFEGLATMSEGQEPNRRVVIQRAASGS